jgi:transposase
MGVLGWTKTRLAAELRREGLTNREIAGRLGVNEVSVYCALGASPHSNRRRHNETLRRRAENLRWEGRTVREIAVELGVPRSTIGGWLAREEAA